MTGYGAGLPSAGQQTRIAVPRYGVLKEISLRTTLLGGAGALQDWGVLGNFERVDLKARDKTIATLHRENIVEWILSQGVTVADYFRAQLASSGGSAISILGTLNAKATIPLPFSYTARVSLAINTRFAEVS